MATYAIYIRTSTTPLQGKEYPNRVAAKTALDEMNRQIACRLRPSVGLEIREVPKK